MVDTHAHLGLCEPSEAELVASARDAGINRILNVGLGEDSNPEAARSAGANDSVFASVGRHPNSAGGFDDAAAEAIEELCAQPGVVAVGETGLDFYRDRAEPDDQRRAFSAQIAIAKRTEKALVVHLRDAEGSEDAVSEAFGTLADQGDGVTVILHCFSAGPHWAERAAERDWYCSFAGNLTYPKAEPIREAAAIVPEDRLLVETDSPFLAPQPVRGKPNQPANVVATAERLAEVRGVPYGELERTVEANAARVFGW
ncbi:MAG: TatD DNase family protein [Solirubrobacterales bacterium]|nr:TatD DNase family protein [Solirubrobacterales bacterium]